MLPTHEADDDGGPQAAATVRARRGVSWRIAAGGVLLAAALAAAGLGWWLKAGAERSLDEARSRALAAEQSRSATALSLVTALQAGGDYAAAAAVAEADLGLPPTVRDNARLARYEAETLFDVARLQIDRSFDVDGLLPAGAPQRWILRGFYSGIATWVPGRLRHCDLSAPALRVKLAPDATWFVVHDPGRGSVDLLRSPECTMADERLAALGRSVAARREGRRIADVQPLPGPALVIGWSDGEVELHRPDAAPRALASLPAPPLAIESTPDAGRFVLLAQDGELSLVDAAGRPLAAPLRLGEGTVLTTTEPAWRDWAAAAWPGVGQARPVGHGERARLFATSVDADGAGAAHLLLLAPDEDAGLLDAAVLATPADGCRRLVTLSAQALTTQPLAGDCAAREGVARWPLPVADGGYAAGALCRGSGALVLGGWRGDVHWLRLARPLRGQPARLELEHRERTWDESATALVCNDDGSVHAGYRNRGVKAFRPRVRLQEAVIPVSALRDAEAPMADDQSWEVTIQGTLGQLELESASGELALLWRGRYVWRRKPVDLAPPQPGAQPDRIVSLRIDAPRGRAWLLTSLGRIELIDVPTGAVLARFATSYAGAAPSTEMALQKPLLDGTGGFSFVHRFRDRAVQVRAMVSEP